MTGFWCVADAFAHVLGVVGLAIGAVLGALWVINDVTQSLRLYLRSSRKTQKKQILVLVRHYWLKEEQGSYTEQVLEKLSADIRSDRYKEYK